MRDQTPLESLLNPAQREVLTQFIETQSDAIRSQLTSYRNKREMYQRQMDDDFEWRRGGGGSRRMYSSAQLEEWANSIFEMQNDSLNIVGGFAAFMTARTIDDVFGTEPFFTVYPEGLADKSLSEALYKHSEWRLRQSNFKPACLDAIDCAVGLGEAVLKQTWKRDVDVYEKTMTVLSDVAAGKPVVTVDGGYVEQNVDKVAPDTFIEEATQKPVSVLRVEKDPSLVLDVTKLAWRKMEVEQTNVSYDNVQASVMHWGDLLIQENVADINDAVFVGHECQMRLSELRAIYDLDDATVELFRNDSQDAKTTSAKPIQHLGEQPLGAHTLESTDPLIKVIEGWMKCDPVGDHRQRRIYALYAPEHRVIIEMDYIANRTPTGLLPMQVIRAFSVKNRWYGRGYFEIYEKAQEFIDRHLNYIAYRNRFHSTPAIFFDQSLLMEEDDAEDFELIPGKTYRLKPGVKVEDVIQAFEIPDLDERTWQIMQMMIQVVQVRSGITSAAQGDTSSLPSTSTATGIESILQSASTLARQPMNLMKSGLEKALLYAVKLIHANLSADEVFTYFEGDEAMVGSLMREQIKSIDVNVRLLLTRFKARENIEAADKAIAAVAGVPYIALPEGEKTALRPLYIQAVKGLGFDNATSIVRQAIVPMVDPVSGQPMLDATGQPMMQPPPAAGAPAAAMPAQQPQLAA